MADYVFQEYPKWVTPPAGVQVIVRSRSEEDDVMGLAKPAPAVKTESSAATGPVEIPADWATMHWMKKVALAKQLPGGEAVQKADEATSVIVAELERCAAVTDAEPDLEA